MYASDIHTCRIYFCYFPVLFLINPLSLSLSLFLSVSLPFPLFPLSVIFSVSLLVFLSFCICVWTHMFWSAYRICRRKDVEVGSLFIIWFPGIKHRLLASSTADTFARGMWNLHLLVLSFFLSQIATHCSLSVPSLECYFFSEILPAQYCK